MNISFYLRPKLFSTLKFNIYLYVYIIEQQDTKDHLDSQIIDIILSGMSDVSVLTRDNLSEYMDKEDLIVVYSTNWCNKCVRLKPFLYELPENYTVVIVDAEKFLKSVKFMPGGVNGYPTIALFNRGYFIEELDTQLILTKTLK